MTTVPIKNNTENTSPFYSMQLRNLWIGGMVLMITVIFTVVYLLPFGNMALLAVKDSDQQVASATGSVLPLETYTFEYDGQVYDTYKVPFEPGTTIVYEDGTTVEVTDSTLTLEMALVSTGRRTSQLLDLNNVEAGLIEWEGNWRGLEPLTFVNPKWDNFQEAWDGIDFPKVFGNTLYIAIVGMIGTIISSMLVGYAFARFPIPGKNIIFMVLIGTIILPPQVTLIPTFAFFSWMRNGLSDALVSLGLPGPIYAPLRAVIAYLPLTLPHFFANAYNVFLFRQYFMTLPKELDEAAMIDGAGPLRILIQIIIPLSWPVIIAVALFHFIFAWNDYFAPLIYLLNYPDLNPIAVAVQVFNYTFGARPELVQATSLMAMVLPLAIFFFAQRIFMRGVVLTGVDK